MKIVVIKKNGTLCDLDWKKNIDLKDIYKKAGFRKENDFAKRNTWKIGDNDFISVFSKNTGRANTENKYELPPPVDSDLYFGKLIVMRHSEQNPAAENCLDLTADDWNTIYDKLMGGFEDLDDNEEESEEEYVAPEDLTKQGYKKDGFVVEDVDSASLSGESDEEEWISSDNEDTDDSLEGTEEEEDHEKDNPSDKDETDEEYDDKKNEYDGETDSSMPSLISGSDNELQEESYKY
jgi:hypothetical protein|tara:strand:- start:1137 stop:1844 length:708 start_codon:yes stop_codon:yes gene_type:complete